MKGHRNTQIRAGYPKPKLLAQVRPPEGNINTKKRQDRRETNRQREGNLDRNVKDDADKVFGYGSGIHQPPPSMRIERIQTQDTKRSQ